MLLLGPLGVLHLSDYLLHGKHRSASLSAGITYLFNLATVQYYYVPLETFSTFYGFLPWLLWAALRYLDTRTTKQLLIFFLLNLAATAAFHVQTLFIVYVVVLSMLVLAKMLSAKVFRPALLQAVYLMLPISLAARLPISP